MATKDADKYPTLATLAMTVDPKGNVRQIAEVLNKVNNILDDAPFFEADETWSTTVYRRASLPTGSVRNLNDGVTLEYHQKTAFRETIMMLDARSQIDQAILDSASNPKEFRSKEAMPFLEGMSQNMVNYWFYGNSATDSRYINGIATRKSTLDTAIDSVCIGSGGTSTGYLTSIYVVKWGERKTHMIYPREHAGVGIKHQAFGPTLIDGVTTGTKFPGYEDYFSWHCGLACWDERSIGRLANIPTKLTSTVGVFDEDDLIRLVNNMEPDDSMRIYVNPYLMSNIQILLKDKTNVNFTADGGNGLSGAPVIRFQNIPIRLCRGISNAETAIT